MTKKANLIFLAFLFPTTPAFAGSLCDRIPAARSMIAAGFRIHANSNGGCYLNIKRSGGRLEVGGLVQGTRLTPRTLRLGKGFDKFSGWPKGVLYFTSGQGRNGPQVLIYPNGRAFYSGWGKSCDGTDVTSALKKCP